MNKTLVWLLPVAAVGLGITYVSLRKPSDTPKTGESDASRNSADSTSQLPGGGEGAAAGVGGVSAGNGGGDKQLHVFNWANYIDPQVYKDFEAEFGVKVVEETFDSNETLRNKLQAGVTGYDVIVPSDYTVQQLVKEGLLAELDLQKIPNLQHVSPKFKGLYFDKTNSYSVPYLWGTTGIGYNAKKVQPAPTSWADLFEPGKLEPYKNRVSMLDDPRESIGAALKFLGYSLNSTNPAELEAAKNALLKQKKVIARYDTETFREMLGAGDMLMVHGWSGDVARAKTQNPDVSYVIPKEGGTIWADNLAIPKNSTRKDIAHAFINFVQRPEVNAKIVNVTKYPSANDGARAHIKPEILNDPNIYPSDEVIAKLEWILDVGQAAELYDKIWTELKSAQ